MGAARPVPKKRVKLPGTLTIVGNVPAAAPAPAPPAKKAPRGWIWLLVIAAGAAVWYLARKGGRRRRRRRNPRPF